MRFEGTLTEWNPDRGYGAIVSVQGGPSLFVHFSAFPADAAPPTLGEPLSFEVVSGRDGRKQATRVQRSGRRVMPSIAQQRLLTPAPRRRYLEEQRRRRFTTAALLAGLALSLATLGWMHLSQPASSLLAQRLGGVTLR